MSALNIVLGNNLDLGLDIKLMLVDMDLKFIFNNCR